MRTQTSTQTILDYVGAVAYRKFDRSALEIPAFHAGMPAGTVPLGAGQHKYMLSDYSTFDRKAREILPRRAAQGSGIRLPTDLGSRLGPVEALLDGSRPDPELGFALRLAHVLAHSARPMRWEPYNTYQVHRGIASARCLFTCDVRVALRDPETGRYRLYLYVGEEHLLLRLDDAPVEAPLFAGAALAFAITGDVARCIDPYGEFAPNLIGPEAGLLAGQIEYLCAAVGWRTDGRALFDPAEARSSMRIRSDTEVPMSVVLVETGTGDLDEDLETEVRFTAPEWPRHLLDHFETLPDLLAASQDAEGLGAARLVVDRRLEAVMPLPETGPSEGPAGPDLDILELVRKRHSGSYMIGFVPRAEGFDSARLASLIRDWLRISRLPRSTDLQGIDIVAYLSVLRITGGRPARYRIDFRTGIVELVDETDLTDHFSTASTMPMSNFRELNIVVTFTCGFAREIAALGPRAYFLAHQATGWLAHAFGLAAARQDMFSRPVRMYDDGVLDALVRIDGQPTIQLLCGHNRASKLSFEIG
jgi:hypothetical protein